MGIIARIGAACVLVAGILTTVMASPIDSCSAQASCLVAEIDPVCVGNTRTVCMTWTPSDVCQKAATLPTTETVSHACAGLHGSKDADGDGSEEWGAQTSICVDVEGGHHALFGVKDGRECSGAGDYVFQDGTAAACYGPTNVCEGGNVKECMWRVPTDPCPSVAPIPTPTASIHAVPAPTPSCVTKRVYTTVVECTDSEPGYEPCA